MPFFLSLNILFLEHWINYSDYLKHDVVFGCCGMHPMFTHKFDLTVELNLRVALQTKRVVGVGEIGIDLTR